MSEIQNQRRRIAEVTGVELANRLSDDQLPAVLNFIDGDEDAVRTAAEAAMGPNVQNPVALFIHSVRAKRHTGKLPVPSTRRASTAPVALTDEEFLVQRARMREWARIKYAIRTNREVRDLWAAFWDSYGPDPTPAQALETKTVLLEVLDQMNIHRPQEYDEQFLQSV